MAKVDNQKKDKPMSGIGRNKLVVIIIAAFLLLTLVFGLTLGIISLVRSSGAVVEYGGVSMDSGVASFFISRFKIEHIKNLKKDGYITASDSPVFWSLPYNSEYTQGEYFKLLCEQRLKEVVLENYIFESSGASLSDSDEKIIEKTVLGSLSYEANDSEEEFDLLSEKYGFTYEDYERAAEMYYIWDRKLAFSALYGSDGAAISSDTAACREFLSEYSHVKLLFIRLADYVDNGGERPKLAYLSEKECAERADLVERIKAAISAYESGSDGKMTETAFNNFLENNNDGDKEMNSQGYYLHEASLATAELRARFPELVRAALDMEIGSYRAVDVDMFEERLVENPTGDESSPAVCFIYKYEPDDGAYKSATLSTWFSDFYNNAAEKSFSSLMEKYLPEVTLKDKLAEIDFLSIAGNDYLYPKWESLE